MNVLDPFYNDKELYLYLYFDCDTIHFVYILPLCFPATPADVSLLMQLGVDGVFVGSGIFKSSNPTKRARAMAQAVTHFRDPKILAEISEDLGEAMFGVNAKSNLKFSGK